MTVEKHEILVLGKAEDLGPMFCQGLVPPAVA
jgi:hypothetical protein